MGEDEKIIKNHSLQIIDRVTVAADGVIFVESFDEAALVLSTNMGSLTVEGRELKIEEFSKETGKARITGRIDGVYYADERRQRKKLFERFIS